jgi:hypothetical protein
MDLQYLAVISSYALNPAFPPIRLKLKRRPLILIEAFILCMLSTIFIRIDNRFIDIDSAERYSDTHQIKMLPTQAIDYQSSIPMSNELWRYLRAGLNYLESSGKNYPPNFVHAGGVAYGPLALTHIAALDVMQNRRPLSGFTLEEVFSKTHVYEEFAKNYADLLLRHYLNMDYCNMSQEEVFDVLQRAWFLGPSLYKKGAKALPSREKRAQEYIARISQSLQ